MSSNLRQALASLALLAFSSLLSLALGEVALRLLDSRPAVKGEDPRLDLMQPNPRGTGSFRLKPNLDLKLEVEGLDVRFRTNRFGMPWRDVSQAKPEGVRRVAVLGDSFAMGCWTPSFESNFVGLMEKSLARLRFEALDFGVGGYGPLDEELLLHEEVFRFSPDLVLVALFTGNDFRDTWLGLDKEAVVEGTAVLQPEVLVSRIPEAERIPDGVRSPFCAAEPGLPALVSRSHLFRRIGRLLDRDGLCVDFKPSAHFMQFSYWSRSSPPAVTLEARGATLQALERIRAATESRGVSFGVVAVPGFEQVHARRLQGRNYDVGLPQAWVEAWARQQSVPYLDLLPVFREHLARTGQRLFLRQDVHWNPRGHELAGRAIGEWVACCASRVPRKPEPLEGSPRNPPL